MVNLTTRSSERQLFIDCDGVLADFDDGARRLLGMTGAEYETRYDTQALYDALQAAPEFYSTLRPMPNAFVLMEAVRHHNPVILTGRPRGTWAVAQKLRWRDRWFPGVKMIVCPSTEKRNYGKPGDVLVDDRRKYAKLWTGMGGVFIHAPATRPIEDVVQAVHRAMR